MKSGDLAGSIGRGLVAGVVGTAAMTVSSTIEAKLRHRKPSVVPVAAAGKVLGVQPRNPVGQARFSTVVHWLYGTTWGGVRGVLGGLGMSGPVAAAAHLGLVWGSELVMLPALKVAPPVKKWGSTELAVDGWHHLVYVTATSAAYVHLDRRRNQRS